MQLRLVTKQIKYFFLGKAVLQKQIAVREVAIRSDQKKFFRTDYNRKNNIFFQGDFS